MLIKDHELRCRCGCGLLKLNRGFRDSLEALRKEFGRPMVITSGVRCYEHNETVGGHPKSLHVGDVAMHNGQTGACAVDVATPNGEYRASLFALAWKHGWSIGWNAKRGFLHLDRRIDVGLKPTSFDY